MMRDAGEAGTYPLLARPLPETAADTGAQQVMRELGIGLFGKLMTVSMLA